MWIGSTSDSFTEKKFKDRIRFLSVLFAVGFGILIFRLLYLQVIRGDDFALVSESNRTKTMFLGAPRGRFYDRKGKILIANRPSWSLMYSFSRVDDVSRDDVLKRLRPFLGDFPKRWEKRLKRAHKSKQLVRLLEDVPADIAFGLREMGELLPGFQMEMEFRREYPNGIVAPQLLGYLSEIDERELKHNFWFSRKSGDLIGKMGLEKLLDSKLRGSDGGMLIEVDSIGRLKRVIKELPYVRGNSVLLTIDSNLQKIASEEFGKTISKRGAAVAIDVKTGAILLWASFPEFDTTKNLTDYVMDKNFPFFDRVYKGAYPPGSIFKIITAAAALENKVVKLSEKINCLGYVKIKDRRIKLRKYRCWKRHGQVGFWKAMAESCDTYYYTMAQRLGSQKMYEMSKSFGLGARVQDTLPGENPGNIPSASWKRKKGLGGWSTGDSLNMSIGQGYVTTSPLQMAAAMMGLVNMGIIYRPYIIERIFDSEGKVFFQEKPKVHKKFELADATWANILFVTRLVVKKGTGWAANIPYLEVRGKTGTAQNPHGKDHAWFLASAGYPKLGPEVVVCIFVENGGHGGSAAAPIARKIIESALPRIEIKEAA